MRAGRNDPCPCGSGRKFKRCCLDNEAPAPAPPGRFVAPPEPSAPPRDLPLTTAERALADRLRDELAQFPPAIAETMIFRLTGARDGEAERLIERAARLLADDVALDAWLAAMREGPRLVCQFLASRPYSRGDLVRLLSLRGVDEPGATIAEACRQFPIAWSPGGRADLDRLRTLRTVGDRVAARPGASSQVRFTLEADGAPRRSAAFGLWFALVCLPGVLLRLRPRLNRDRSLHAAEAAKLGRILSHAGLAFGAWAAAGALHGKEFAEVELDRVRECARSSASLLRSTIVAGHDDAVAQLLALACAAPRGAQLSLGDALVAIASSARTPADIETLVHRIGYGIIDASWFTIDRTQDRLALSPDLHAALAGETVGGHPRSLVQASYEILLSPASPFAESTIVALAAELVHVDTVARLRLTKESVVTACGAGVSVDELLSALRVVAGDRPVPVVVETAVREWGAAVSVARVGAHVVCELDPTSASLERAVELLAPLLLRRAAPHVLLLSRAPDRATIASLAKLGVVVSGARPEVDAPRAPPPEPAPPGAALASVAFPPRDLRPFLEPAWALRESEKALARAQVTGAETPPPSTRALPAGDARRGNERKATMKLPRPIAAQIATLRRTWNERRDWIAELDRIVVSKSFHEAVAASPDEVASAFARMDSPQRLNHRVAELAAAARGHSERRASQ